jgi:tRNA modification GTPase
MSTNFSNPDTIAAIATPAGKGGVGIVRVSGPKAEKISRKILKKKLQPRSVYFGNFYGIYQNTEKVLDSGIALFFKGPASFTGEDIVEFQGHGGPVVMDLVLRETLRQGARLAMPGEFSEQAFLNNKIDLAQAEAIADLINSDSRDAAQGALRSLQGEFSSRIHQLVEKLVELRMHVESAIDFPEEEIDFLADPVIEKNSLALLEALEDVLKQARQGTILKDGMTIVIAGKPNAGKSSLLNRLAGRETAIVTPIAGTTRDLLREHIEIDGMPLHIIDTAGLRESPDEIELEGIRRAWQEISTADRILLMTDSREKDDPLGWPEFTGKLPGKDKLTIIRNKCDLTGEAPGLVQEEKAAVLTLSAKTGLGIDTLKEHLKQTVGFQAGTQGQFTARRRHLDALSRARDSLLEASKQLQNGELLAEDLRQAQQALSEITGEFTSDDLLGKIFSSFCIGK